MASIFPGSPSLNDIFTSNGTTWQWNGEAWTVVASDGQTFTNVITSPSSQTITADSPTDTLTIAAGTNISVSANASNDTLTISSTIDVSSLEVDTQSLINTASAAAYASASGYTNFIVDGLDTLDIEENTNLYFTNQRAIDATSSLITSASTSLVTYTDSEINSLTTTDIEEGTNLYFTNERLISAGSATYILQTSQQGIINSASAAAVTAVIDGAPGALDTLNELAAALGDDQNFATSVTNSLSGKLDISTASATYLTQAAYASASPNFATDAELASAIVTASAAAVAYADALTTADVAENTNLYFTDERAVNSGSSTYILQTNQQTIINSASAAAYASSSAYTDSEINALTTNDIPEPIIEGSQTFTVINDGLGAYVVDGVSNPTFNLVRGKTYTFVINASGHPFWIQTVSGGYSSGNIYSTGTTNLGTDNGTITWSIPLDAPSTLYYACQFHSSMQGTINIVDPGDNLYFTNERAINAGSATYIPLTSQQSIINSASAAAVTAVLDGAPGALDTLNELAAALNDDSNFATTVTNSLSAKLDASSASTIYLTQTSASSSYVAQNSTGNEYIQDQASNLLVHELHTNITATYDDENNRVVLVGSTSGGSVSGEFIQDEVSSLFVHSNHTNITATYDDANNEIILVGSAGSGSVSGGATVAYQTTQPDVTSLEAGSLWIDSDEDAISGLLPATFTRWIKILSASATTISGLDDNVLSLLYTAGYEKVFINGTLLVRGSDYTASTGNTIVLTTAAESGDSVEVHAYESFQIADTYTQAAADAKFFAIDESRVDRWTKTFGASAMAISGSDDYAQTLDYTSGLESLFINGVLVDPSEYTRTSASVITMDEAILSGDVVDVISPKAFEVANTYTIAQIDAKYNNRTRWTKTFSASASVISGVDDNSNTLSYTSGYEEVYLNGILLTPITDYARTSASVITLGSAVVINDIIDVVNIQPFNVADVYTEAESDAKYLTQVSASSTYAPVAAGALIQVVPTSITATGGSGSISSTGAVSFTSASAISLNGCFNSTYDSYYVSFSSTATGLTSYRNRLSGTDASGASDYQFQYKGTYGAGTDLSGGSTGASSVNYFGNVNSGTQIIYTQFWLNNVAKADTTTGIIATLYNDGAARHVRNGNMWHTPSNAYDGFTIINTGTMSGTIRIYGYRN